MPGHTRAAKITCKVVRRPHCRWHWQPSLKHAAPHLIQLDRLEQGTEITLTESLVALTLDDLEENRADDILRENLEQHTIALARIAVDENCSLLERSERLPVALHA